MPTPPRPPPSPAPPPPPARPKCLRPYAATPGPAGFAARVQDYYERVWGLFAPAGHARLFFAELGGERVATLFHFTCGDRAAEAYGGMTDAGAESRANYLLKWEAIRAFREQGFASYDLWGIATGGIAPFQEGFGGPPGAYGLPGAGLRPLRPGGHRHRRHRPLQGGLRRSAGGLRRRPRPAAASGPG